MKVISLLVTYPHTLLTSVSRLVTWLLAGTSGILKTSWRYVLFPSRKPYALNSLYQLLFNSLALGLQDQGEGSQAEQHVVITDRITKLTKVVLREVIATVMAR